LERDSLTEVGFASSIAPLPESAATGGASSTNASIGVEADTTLSFRDGVLRCLVAFVCINPPVLSLRIDLDKMVARIWLYAYHGQSIEYYGEGKKLQQYDECTLLCSTS
jgi:hypothetical protein